MTKIQEVARRVAVALNPEKILLFGSYAWGQPDGESDIDLYVIVSDTAEPGYRLARRAYKSLKGVGVPVDVVIRSLSESQRNSQVTASLDREVLEKGMVLYG